jgi:hypothetical protein
LTEFGKTVTFDIKNEKVVRYASARLFTTNYTNEYLTVNNIISYGNNIQPENNY